MFYVGVYFDTELDKVIDKQRVRQNNMFQTCFDWDVVGIFSRQFSSTLCMEKRERQ